MNNLRPISILCGLSKVFEKILKGQIHQFVESFNLLSDNQSGFRPAHSTTTAILKVTDDILKTIDKKGMAFLLLIDFSKAFDRVSHAKLINKLTTQFYFSQNASNLIRSYLSGRAQVVHINNTVSRPISILSGVPQGSILGPLLFSMFINDLPSILKHCSILMFADDVQLYLGSTELSIDALAQLINEDLNSLLSWSQQNFLPINADKTKVMLLSRSRFDFDLPRIYLGQDTIEYVTEAVLLGFVIQQNLEWDSHVNSQCNKIYMGLRQLRLTSSMLNYQTKMQLFKSLILPHFMYGAEILLNASARSLDRLRVALNCCVRYVFNLNRYSRVTHLQPLLLGCPFYEFAKLRSCLLLNKIVSRSSPTYLFEKLQRFQSPRTRNFVIPNYNTSHYGNTLFVRGIAYWNQLPNELKNIDSVNVFRRDCIAWFNRRN